MRWRYCIVAVGVAALLVVGLVYIVALSRPAFSVWDVTDKGIGWHTVMYDDQRNVVAYVDPTRNMVFVCDGHGLSETEFRMDNDELVLSVSRRDPNGFVRFRKPKDGIYVGTAEGRIVRFESGPGLGSRLLGALKKDHYPRSIAEVLLQLHGKDELLEAALSELSVAPKGED
jgi:hypothetical protein